MCIILYNISEFEMTFHGKSLSCNTFFFFNRVQNFHKVSLIIKNKCVNSVAVFFSLFPHPLKKVCLMFTGKGKGRGRIRPEDEEELGNARPSAPSTLFDFLESKMGTLTVEGKLLKLKYLESIFGRVGGLVFFFTGF